MWRPTWPSSGNNHCKKYLGGNYQHKVLQKETRSHFLRKIVAVYKVMLYKYVLKWEVLQLFGVISLPILGYVSKVLDYGV
jgi:hypothetical protein